MIRRPPRSTQSRSSAASDVYKRQVLASTDAAAVFSVLRRVPLPRRLSGLLEAESGFNDAPVVILVLALAAQASPGQSGHEAWWQLLLVATAELAGGAVAGLLIGYAGGHLMRRIGSSSSGLFSIGVVSLTVLASVSYTHLTL